MIPASKLILQLSRVLALFFTVFSPVISYAQSHWTAIPAEGVSAGEITQFLEQLSPVSYRLVYSKGSTGGSISEPSNERRTLRFVSFLLDSEGQDKLREVKASSLFRAVEADAWGQLASCEKELNDPGMALSWHLYNDGSRNNAKEGADIKACPAWSLSQGSKDVILGFVDSGVRTDHSDLTGRIWINEGEIEGNNVDDDENGYIDDYYGWNTYNSTNDLNDAIGHGTQINGIAGANPNNQSGFVGLDWNCKLLNVKGVNDAGQGLQSWWAEGVYYLVDQGADVINLSLSVYKDIEVFRDAIKYADGKGVLVVAATGNEDNFIISYPAAYPSVMAVGATDHADARARWNGGGSNYGPELDVVAPGKAIYGINPVNNSTSYVTAGTSQAAPQVAALATLLKARLPEATIAEIWALIEENADDQVGPAEEDTEGYDEYFGHGRINAYASLWAAQVASSIGEGQQLGTVSAYPNPSNGLLNITSSVAASYRLFAWSGQLIKQGQLVKGNQRIDLSDQPKGVYLFQAILPQGRVEAQRIVIE